MFKIENRQNRGNTITVKKGGPGRIPLPKKTGGYHGVKKGRGSYNRRPKHKNSRHDP